MEQNLLVSILIKVTTQKQKSKVMIGSGQLYQIAQKVLEITR